MIADWNCIDLIITFFVLHIVFEIDIKSFSVVFYFCFCSLEFWKSPNFAPGNRRISWNSSHAEVMADDEAKTSKSSILKIGGVRNMMKSAQFEKNCNKSSILVNIGTSWEWKCHIFASFWSFLQRSPYSPNLEKKKCSFSCEKRIKNSSNFAQSINIHDVALSHPPYELMTNTKFLGSAVTFILLHYYHFVWGVSLFCSRGNYLNCSFSMFYLMTPDDRKLHIINTN